MTNWETTKASDFCLSVRDGTHDSPKRVEEGKYLITSRHIIGGEIDLANAYLISNSDYDEVNRRSKVDRWDVLFTMIGTVGEVCLVKDEPNFAIKNIGLFKSKNELDGKWLYYFLQSKETKKILDSLKRGTTQAYIPLGELRNLNILYPASISETQNIISILSALDDKIENNRRINETLEEMARAMFKSWFVDFDPVHAKAAGNAPAHMDADTAALFPSSFGDDGLPEGWINKPLDEVADFLNGAAMQKFPAEGSKFLPVIKIAELRNGISSNTNRASLNVPEKYVVTDGDVLFAWSGSLMQKVWTEGKGALNQHLFKVTSNSYQKWFFYYWVDHHMKWFQSIAASKATTMGHIQRKHLSEAKVCVSHKPVMDCASDAIAPLLEKQTQNLIESRTLAELRDTLLPKLMSGEIRVADAEREVEAL